MSQKRDQCLKILKENGFRLTRQRISFIECLCAHDKPLTPKEITEAINSKDKDSKKTDMASVYRFIEQLRNIKLVHEVHPAKGFYLCLHQNCGQRFHLLIHCTRCSTTEEKHVPDELTQPMIWYLRSQAYFEPEEHFLQISGLCKLCR